MRIHAIIDDTSTKIQAAFAGPEMKAVGSILKKIEAELSYSDFPISIADLDKHLIWLKTVERIALKAAMSRAGLLR